MFPPTSSFACSHAVSSRLAACASGEAASAKTTQHRKTLDPTSGRVELSGRCSSRRSGLGDTDHGIAGHEGRELFLAYALRAVRAAWDDEVAHVRGGIEDSQLHVVVEFEPELREDSARIGDCTR